ncbi:ectonucleoside triphosphate diphosphohydrolase 8-like [Mya arenaria]|uniref:ectonucleoside triphosphate diphosphohydrolase 8-like n=1 Tax=Mya arenaria TaxID=6604 RepID=UPI0022E644D7|nr:ectonucleoside triphosphate diphosphohydrolase 8-like [Mya arenaria]XP_052771374.1 ectonucleoside triphosphate diphosphohydrolase 8-like [Mya arenaria]
MDDILVEVVSRLPDHDGKQFSIATTERNTVAGLIRKVCKEHGIPMKTSYTLRDKRERVLQWSQTLLNLGIRHGDVVYLNSEEEDLVHHNPCSWNSWWFVAAVSLLIGGVGITAITIMFTRNGETPYQYGVVLDAGSSHTQLFVYRWEGGKLENTAQARQIFDKPVQGSGLTSYENNISALAGPLSDCLQEAKGHVPYTAHKTTPIFLGATAGMRMLNEVDSSKSNAILNQVRLTFEVNSTFFFPNDTAQARIISGQEEGTFGWVTANYVSGKLGAGLASNELSDPLYEELTVGALDMGGASTQITFYTPDHAQIPQSYREDLDLYGRNYTVYTHSYLCYGINEAIRQYQAILVKTEGYNTTNITNPCGPDGYTIVLSHADIFEAPCANKFSQLDLLPQPGEAVADNYTLVGKWNETECSNTVRKLFNFDANCTYPPCTFNGTYQPKVHGEFYAFSSFYYEMDFLNLTRKSDSPTLTEFEDKLSSVCALLWDEVKVLPTGNPSSLGWYCFEGHYIHTLLIDAYKFNNKTWNNIHFVKKINNTDVGWTLGYMINSSNTIQPLGPQTFISTTAFSSLTALFCIFILLSVAFGCYARRYQEQRARGFYEPVPAYGAV